MHITSSILSGLWIIAGTARASLLNQNVVATSSPTLDGLSAVGTAVEAATITQAPVVVDQEAQDLRRNAEANPQGQVSSSQPFLKNTFTSLNSSTTLSSNLPSANATSQAGTSIAVFTAGNGVYTATAISSAVIIAGYQLHVGGGAAMVGGVQVSAASSGFVENGSTIKYTQISAAPTPASTVASSTASSVISSTTASSASAAAASSSTGRGAAPIQTPSSMQALAMIGGIAMMLV